jgi:nucleolar pre-ribosomal-associated protein 1
VDLAHYLVTYLAESIKIGEDRKVVKLIAKKLAAEVQEDSESGKLLENFRKLVNTIAIQGSQLHLNATTQGDMNTNGHSAKELKQIVKQMLEDSTNRAEDHSSLVRWTTKEVDEVIEGGHAAALILLLSSQHLSIRKEALTNISKFSAKLKESTAEEKEQIWLLLSEIVETSRRVVDQEPLPTIVSAFASHAIAVLNDPLHCLYAKINKFLSQGPTWELDKIPLMYKILDEAPTLDDAHYLEISWLLTYLLDGLRSATDMTICRKRRVFEKLFSLYSSPYTGTRLRQKILNILFRATTIAGGSTTLITRFSSMTWLQAQVALGEGVSLEALMAQILESCDNGRISIWSNKGAGETKMNTLQL